MPPSAPGLTPGVHSAAPGAAPGAARSAGTTAAASVFDALVAVLLAGEEAVDQGQDDGEDLGQTPGEDQGGGGSGGPSDDRVAGTGESGGVASTSPALTSRYLPPGCTLPTARHLAISTPPTDPAAAEAADRPAEVEDADVVAPSPAEVEDAGDPDSAADPDVVSAAQTMVPVHPDLLATLGPDLRPRPATNDDTGARDSTANAGVDRVRLGPGAPSTADASATSALPSAAGTGTDTGAHTDTGTNTDTGTGAHADRGTGAGSETSAEVEPGDGRIDAVRHDEATGSKTGAEIEARTAAAPAPSAVTLSPSPSAAGPLDGAAGLAPAAQAAPTAPAAPLTAAQSRTLVADQVAPAVARLTQAGPGTHRLVLKLDPEHLGPVRVTLTLHQGTVSVRLAAGSAQARAALAEGSTELHRMLGLRASETRVSVHDLTSSTVAVAEPRVAEARALDTSAAWDDQRPGTTETTTSGQGRHGSASGEQERPARTRVGSDARDGDTVTATRPGPTDPLRSRRPRLDLSI